MIEFLIFALATWRISSILVYEDGPNYIFRRFRMWSGIGYDSVLGEIDTIKENWLSGVLSCLWCCSVWVGTFFIALHLFYPLVAIKIAAVFALSTVAIVIDRFVSR